MPLLLFMRLFAAFARRLGRITGLLALLALLFFSILVPASLLAEGGKTPRRIVSLGPLITENIYLLGADELLVGNTIYCDRPEAARFKDKVGSVQELAIEKILVLKPDLILASNLASPIQMDKLKSLGLRVEMVKEMTSFADICDEFLRLGRLLGQERKAIGIVAQARAQVSTVRAAVAGLAKKKVFIQVGAHPLFASVDKSFTNDFILFAGGENIVAGQRSGSVKVEQVIALNPDVIIVAVMGAEHGIAADEKRKWLNFKQISATRNNQVYVMDPNVVCSPSPLTFAETLEEIARLIHPGVKLESGQP